MNGSSPTQVISLFVENIPRAFHWKGIWFLFARYGNVVGAFIANKLSRNGMRFGFVRFGSKVEAERGKEKLNGFVLNGFKLSVQFEKSRGLSRVGGKMPTVCSMREISFRLQKWGLKSIKVQRIGERATWIKVSGVPLQCWNHITLKRVAELWGNFESLGENADHSIDYENVTILITTNQDKRIDEIVEIEIGNNIHLGGSNDHKEDFHMSSTEEDNSGASSAKFERTEEEFIVEMLSYECEDKILVDSDFCRFWVDFASFISNHDWSESQGNWEMNTLFVVIGVVGQSGIPRRVYPVVLPAI
ncbi:hypothetical protein F3Y22_tig00111392pilonHSYRG00536 [Hibiscus syriacus]|uniref:RRM domain-containing protein n=1 Tax=Hibiscus syriacus TaxID=106335 RepID=A0A6A2YLQ3_HIBSY|nr:hypothetical protein F3Y22_tig00111392pilonHSYRG00536 [Hibiscus syriacus]